MARQWFVLQDERELGPFSSHDLKSLAESGRIKRETTVRLGDSV